MLLQRAQEEKATRLEKVVEHLNTRLSAKDANQLATFVRRYYERVSPHDLAENTIECLYGGALALWKFAGQRTSGEARVRVYNPRIDEHGWASSHTIVEIVNDDMPFLVDSVTGELGRLGHHVHLVVHPVLPVKRDKTGALIGLSASNGATAPSESWMHIEISEQSDPDILETLAVRLQAILRDVRAAVDDWPALMQRLDETINELCDCPPPLGGDEVDETVAFLRWMRENHFTFLGSREYAYEKKGRKDVLTTVADSGLGILRDAERQVLFTPDVKQTLAPIVQQFLNRPELILITKTSVRGTVHRPVHMDYIGVKRYDADGKVVGERRFVGLFTSSTYNRTPRDIPLLRRKVRQVLEQAGLSETSHDGKALTHILETYPRDELFQIELDTLLEITSGILALQERPQIRLFARLDKFERYHSCLIYIPRERLNTDLRLRFEQLLIETLNGRLSNSYTQVGDSPLARLHYIIGINRGEGVRQIDYGRLEALLVDTARSWHDDLRDALVDHWGEKGGIRLAQRYGPAFSASYTEAATVEHALNDIAKMEPLVQQQAVALNLYRSLEDPAHTVRFKIYHPRESVALSDCMPMLENMGLNAIGEAPFRVQFADGQNIWIHDFHLQDRAGAELDLARLKGKFETAFQKVWDGEMEVDGFNSLVLRAGLDWREVVLVRALCKYLRQTGIPFSQAYMEATLESNPVIARRLVDLFHAKFDPNMAGERSARVAEIVGGIEDALEEVLSLDEDRILRRYLNLLQSMLRTNYYQSGEAGGPKPYLSFKLDSQTVTDLPLPRPFREIFVYSPRVEAVHLRGGKVARGGLRWSDRREDFRTEVLGLMKAQMVKNAVIVPVGSKGGFFPKRLPVSGDREEIQKEVIACYTTFIKGMLDLTDNLKGVAAVSPDNIVRYDDDDPYLVVAADKGTATYSDIANGVAIDYGFWLGDAFASGGATGYDHKKMGITARGAWESVKRHFREIDRDVQSEPFTVVGVGDMSGDVFGNGMLLSRQIRLLAAFDHRDVFIDPEPDPAIGWAERQRLFELTRSSWQDYDKSLISKGGGVFSRRSKSIALTPEIKALTGFTEDAVTPAELIRGLLKADVDLLWIGGIGTYVKASNETNDAAGDRANDALRIDGNELRCKVVGEGGNLGFTQLGRIEYARRGGRLNTDAVDNAAGVDCSDHEVNIKILLNAIVEDGEMTEKQRNRLLSEMTDEVGELVLRDNYLQSQALSSLERQGAALLEAHAHFMRALERAGKLDRGIEFLPDEEAISERLAAGEGLSRPELSVLLAYAKMTLYDDLLESDLKESEYLANDLARYFPQPIRDRCADAIAGHRLRAEVIATVTANSIVNRVGVSFVQEIMQETGMPAGSVARAYAIARDAFGMRELWRDIEALDNTVPAVLQAEMLSDGAELLRDATLWFLVNLPSPIRIADALASYAPGIQALTDALNSVLVTQEADALAKRTAQLVERSVPESLARRVAALEPLAAACDVVHVAQSANRPVESVAKAYFAVGARLRLDWLRHAAEGIEPEGHWQRTAIKAIVDDLFSQQRALTSSVLAFANGKKGDKALDAWVEARQAAVARSQVLMEDFDASGDFDLAKLALANRSIRRMLIE